MPPVTQTLILISVIVYIGQTLAGFAPFAWLALWPIGTSFGPGFGPWQLITYAFMHGSLGHIFFNMYALFLFGSELERLFGSRWYLGFFLVSVVSAAIAQLLVAVITNSPPYPTVGASGGVFGLLLGFGMYFPKRTIVPLIPPIPMPAWVFVSLYGVLELYLGFSGRAPGVAHFAHLGGMVGGLFMILQRRGWRF